MEKIFVSRLVSKDFYKIYQKFSPVGKKKFARAVRELFDKKIISEGEYPSFKITFQDLLEIKNKIYEGKIV